MTRQITSALLLSVPVLLCGCATAGYQRAGRTRCAIDRARAVTMSAQHEVHAAGNALQNLTTKEAIDLRPPYHSFAAAVRGLHIQVNRLTNRARAVHKLGSAYMEAWQQQLRAYQSSDIRTVSAERRDAVMDSFKKLNAQFQAADQSLRPLLVDLKDMRRYLSIDLTAAGVASIREQSEGIIYHAAEAHQQLQSLADELNRVDAELSPVKPATEAPAATPKASTPSTPEKTTK